MTRPDILFAYFRNIITLPGIGQKTLQRLRKICGEEVIDLLTRLPRGVVDRTRVDIPGIGTVTLEVEVIAHHPRPRKGAPHRIDTIMTPSSGSPVAIEIVYFHGALDYLREQLPIGQRRLISGKLDSRPQGWTMLHPAYVLSPEKADQLPRFEPIYPLTQGLSNRLFRKAIRAALDGLPPLPEWHDSKLIEQRRWPSFLEALEAVHQPESDPIAFTPAHERLAFDELLSHQFSLGFLRQTYRRQPGQSYPAAADLFQQVLTSLPFSLSETQHHALAEIRADLRLTQPMLRLLMGEVGSGKTVVALLAMLDVLASGAKCALMAPSASLALQHPPTTSTMLNKAGTNIACPLLVGSMTAAQKKSVHEALARPGGLLVIGTQTLIQQDVAFDTLGMVVIDEQHRFGVHQRMTLSRKNPSPPEMLIMTATPIPRTLQMTHFGDLDLTRLEGRNPNASEITTVVINQSQLDSLVGRLEGVLDRKERVFWVCPLREETGKSDLAAAKARFARLQEHFSDRCFLLHGALSATEKSNTMEAFRTAPQGALLVTTTVIEVGIDVPDASTIIIEAAENFGLAQLHQLRGRVGRGGLPGYCLLLRGDRPGDAARKRLEMIRQTNDGFALAEADLKLRGGGEILGLRQSGLPEMKFTDFARDQDLLQQAHDQARYLLSFDSPFTRPRGDALLLLLSLFRRNSALRLIEGG